jgi:predicted nuclease with TOPRIM domain
MVKLFIIAGVLLMAASAALGYHGAAVAQNSRVKELEDENAALKEQLGNIQDLVTQAKSDLDDVETEAQSDESCEDTNAYSDASDVEDKLNEIDSEASY